MVAVAKKLFCLVSMGAATVACDSFDFGRLFGSDVPPAPSRSPAPKPSVAPPPEERAATLTVVVAGDIDLSWVDDEATQGHEGPFNDVRPFFDGGMRIGHLVSPLTSANVFRRDGLRGPASAADAIAAFGFDAIAVSNGHAWDTQKKGFLETLDVLGNAGVSVAGGGKDRAGAYRPALVLAEGWSVAVFSVTAAWPYGALKHHEAARYVAGFDAAELAKAVASAAAEHDLVVVTIHGAGKELGDGVTPKESATLMSVAKAGADVVVGSGAHLPRRIAWVGDRPVLFDLGNLAGGGNDRHPWTRRGIVARISFEPEKSPVVEACPYLVEEHRPVRLAGKRRAMNERIFEKELTRLSEGDDGSRIDPPGRYGCMRVRPLSQAGRGDDGE